MKAILRSEDSAQDDRIRSGWRARAQLGGGRGEGDNQRRRKEERMRIAIFGTGGVGGYFGGRLAQAGEEVSFVARGEHLRALQRGGLRVESIGGDFHINPVQATDDPATIGPVDVVLVGVKTWQLPEAAEQMRSLVGPETVVVPLLNGVEAPAQLAALYGAERVAGGLCSLITSIGAPGLIRHEGAVPNIAFGPLNGRPNERLMALYDALSQVKGITVRMPDDIEAAMWRKFLMITTFSGVGAVTRAPVGVLRSLPETRALLEQSLREIYGVALARGVRVTRAAMEAAMAFMDGLPPGATASMQRDVLAGRPSELEAQNGAVVRLGAEAGVETPLNHFIYHSLLPQERKARGLSEL
jgi:2-dehydropantoate 2-reductase